MATHRVKVEVSEQGLTVHITGPSATRANQKLIQDCFSTLVACAEKNGCFEKGFSAVCLGTIALHDSKTGCCSQAFGFAPAAARR